MVHAHLLLGAIILIVEYLIFNRPILQILRVNWEFLKVEFTFQPLYTDPISIFPVEICTMLIPPTLILAQLFFHLLMKIYQTVHHPLLFLTSTAWIFSRVFVAFQTLMWERVFFFIRTFLRLSTLFSLSLIHHFWDMFIMKMIWNWCITQSNLKRNFLVCILNLILIFPYTLPWKLGIWFWCMRLFGFFAKRFQLMMLPTMPLQLQFEYLAYATIWRIFGSGNGN